MTLLHPYKHLPPLTQTKRLKRIIALVFVGDSLYKIELESVELEVERFLKSKFKSELSKIHEKKKIQGVG